MFVCVLPAMGMARMRRFEIRINYEMLYHANCDCRQLVLHFVSLLLPCYAMLCYVVRCAVRCDA